MFHVYNLIRINTFAAKISRRKSQIWSKFEKKVAAKESCFTVIIVFFAIFQNERLFSHLKCAFLWKKAVQTSIIISILIAFIFLFLISKNHFHNCSFWWKSCLSIKNFSLLECCSTLMIGEWPKACTSFSKSHLQTFHTFTPFDFI